MRAAPARLPLRPADGLAPSEGSALRTRHVAVVGAGLAGLAAALELKREGCRVTLLERSRLLGGKATSFRVGEVEVDCGQHVILGCCTAFLGFAEELGMGDRLRLQDRFEVLMLSGGRRARLRALPLPAPLHLAIPFLGFRGLRLGARIEVARALLSARGHSSGEEMESFATWLDRHHQGETARRGFWEPFIVPAVNAPLDQVSAAAGLFVIRTAFLGDRGAARIGWSTVPLARFAERAAGRCDDVRLRWATTSLAIEDGVLRALRSSGSEVEVDGAVLAIPPERLRRLAGAEALHISGLDRFETQPIVDVHLWYESDAAGDATRLLDGSGAEFAALVGSPVQWVFAKGPGYLCCSLSSAAEWVSQPEQRLVALADAELRSRLPGLAGAALLRGAATRDPDATFVPAPGLRRPGPATAVPNAVIAGAWTDTGWPATMEGAVRSGRQAARTLLAGMGASGGRAAHPTLQRSGADG